MPISALAENFYAGSFPRQEEIHAFRMWKATGNSAHRDKILAKCSNMIDWVVRGYNNGCSDPDMYQEGVLGFLDGLARYTESRGCKLSAYCLIWTKKYVRLYIEETKPVVKVSWRPARKALELEKRIKEFNREFEGLPFTTDELYADETKAIRQGVSVVAGRSFDVGMRLEEDTPRRAGVDRIEYQIHKSSRVDDHRGAIEYDYRGHVNIHA